MNGVAVTGDHHVATRSRGSKVLRHPVAGELTLDWGALACVGDPDQQLVIRTAEPGAPSHDGLRILASWSAGPDRSAAEHQDFGPWPAARPRYPRAIAAPARRRESASPVSVLSVMAGTVARPGSVEPTAACIGTPLRAARRSTAMLDAIGIPYSVR